MWMNNVILIVVGLAAGFAAAAGVFALIAGLGIVPRMAGKTSSAAYVPALENALIAGGIFGSVISVFPQIPLHFGMWFAIVFGVFAGTFTGCLSVALAEVLNVFPIMFRRINLKEGLSLGILFFALGKLVGGLYYFTVMYP